MGIASTNKLLPRKQSSRNVLAINCDLDARDLSQMRHVKILPIIHLHTYSKALHLNTGFTAVVKKVRYNLFTGVNALGICSVLLILVNVTWVLNW